MNEKEYEVLCNACDKLLLTADSKLTRIAIPWLHIIREHPVLIKKYTQLFSSARQEKFILKSIFKSISIISKGIIHVLRSFVSIDYLRTNTIGNRKIDYLFVSHILNESQAGLNEDFYFGSVPISLAKDGKSVVIVLLNHSSVSARILSRKWVGSIVPRVILTSKITLGKGLQTYWQMLDTFFEIIKFSRKESDRFTKCLAAQAAVEALSAGTFANMRLEWQIASIVKEYKPFNIIVTYEGHAYERMVFYGAQRANPHILCIGYQHSALFRLQHSFRRLLNKQFNCKTLFTSSLFVKQRLLEDNSMVGVQIEVLGSNRGIEMQEAKINNISNSCLVLPEGFIEECEVLFSYSLNLAKEMPEMHFIWRLHPAISFEQLKANNKLFDRLPHNIILSDKSLDDDIQRSSIALYRGTTAIVKAVAAGLIPVYFKVTEDEMTIDPLYAIDKGKLVVNDSSDFITLFEKIHAVKIYQQQLAEIKKFCCNFFDPINIQVFEKLRK